MRFGIIGLFILTVIAGLIWQAPARLVFDGLQGSGVQAGLVQGTVWDAQAHRVRLGALTVAELNAHMQPAGLLSGAGVFDVRVQDPRVQLEGQVRATASQLAIQDLQGAVQFSAFPQLSGLPLPAQSGVFLDGVSVRLDQAGACVSAEGAGMTALLSDMGTRYGLDLPLVDLEAYCAGADLGFTLSGQSQALSVEGFVTVNTSALRYRVEARSTVSDVIGVLVALGFENEGDVWIAESAF